MKEFISELWAFLKYRKKFWLLPLIVILLLMSILVILAGGSALAPFIYTLF
jgi:competence protein ComGC